MSEDKKSEEVTVESTENTTSTLGQKLSQARESLGFSIGEVAERLKLSARQIEALERDDYSNLPEPVFVRGFLRSYARFLNLDEAEVVADLDAVLPNKKEDSKTESTTNKSKAQAPKPSVKISPKVILAVIMVLIIGVVVATQTKLFSGNQSDSGANNVAMGELAPPDTANTDNLLIVSDVSEQALGNIASQESIPPQDVLVETGGLTITTGYRSSLKVLDADGHEIINKIVSGKTPQKVEGNAPFTVRIGYAKDTVVQYNGKNIDIASDIQNNTAEFIVPKQP